MGALGLGLGLVVALPASRLLEGLLFGIDAHDAATVLAVSAGLAAVTLAACGLPARRALRVDPIVALRSD